MSELRTLVRDLTFPEGPRWHRGRLFFSDFYSHRVLAVDLDGNLEEIATVPHQPSGLGWLPDGRLLVVSMRDRRLLRLDGNGLVEVADLSAVAPSHCNDMVVDAQGRAYIGNFGFDRHQGEEPRTTTLVRVDPDGAVTVAADDLFFPNGTVITPDERMLVVAETWGARLTAFDRAPDGTLSNRRLWAPLAPHAPDGICLDQEGAIWVADPRSGVVVRVLESGEITERIETERAGAYACMLGGDDGRTLFVATNSTSGPEAAQRRDGRIEWTRVAVPRAGWP